MKSLQELLLYALILDVHATLSTTRATTATNADAPDGLTITTVSHSRVVLVEISNLKFCQRYER